VIIPLTPWTPRTVVPNTASVIPEITAERPWAPFCNLADFEYTETAVSGLLSKELVDKQLAGFNSAWSIGSHLSIRNNKDMEASLAMACEYIIQASISILLSYMPY
jgi:hypothetical protein